MGVAKRWVGFLMAAALCIGAGRTVMAHTAGSEASDNLLHGIATPHATTIPQDALRLRIIANSDSAADQTLKLEIRNAVVEEVGQLVQHATSAAEAKQIVEAHLDQIRATAVAVEHQHGVYEPISANVGEVPFPTKIYGNDVYPAGNYDALRIIIGKGQGANWWCVLYPPLCFVDITEGDAVPNTGSFPDLPPLETIDVPTASGKKQPVQVRLWTVDHGEEIYHALTHMFH
ncbi:hypothetical protein Alches_20380 [Alicyclobacillus hesperidum subsp. aegles]|uniref:Stage II sporulation protein R n=1 Tax=Alicyclobacillus hesperidum TaxID=89784 RepID=A0A1H2XA22_9BACL|nr:stage II sporulation protein R [Alicyclobacillus hesperidum]KRW92123.1 stage II sporulation protein R [Alicyclobacillus tengchongensis]GLG01997.1 hypothetical protein Alches_20380 [Alicyclobacillus hesperidum subsp. aegles]GLV14230.1 hypothetical protein Heshes_19140 [Alicyclobacillus hesperidum]SDW89294.1 stage II sporulation protein R [Alicyclobacillus hesperidum]